MFLKQSCRAHSQNSAAGDTSIRAVLEKCSGLSPKVALAKSTAHAGVAAGDPLVSEDTSIDVAAAHAVSGFAVALLPFPDWSVGSSSKHGPSGA